MFAEAGSACFQSEGLRGIASGGFGRDEGLLGLPVASGAVADPRPVPGEAADA